MKTCNKCKIERVLSEFYGDKTHRDGKRTNCKWCEGAHVPKEKRCLYGKCNIWFWTKSKNQKFHCAKCNHKNREDIRSRSFEFQIYQLGWRKKNREKLSERSKVWYWANRDRALENTRRKDLRRKLSYLYYQNPS